VASTVVLKMMSEAYARRKKMNKKKQVKVIISTKNKYIMGLRYNMINLNEKEKKCRDGPIYLCCVNIIIIIGKTLFGKNVFFCIVR
jgi:hypothetical protein